MRFDGFSAGRYGMLLWLGLVPPGAGAQGYPAKPPRLIVSFSAGSGTDTIARIVAGRMATAMGQQIIVDNRGGAAGNIGAEIAARAPADGYTLFLANLGHAAKVSIYRKLPYDLARDFAPVVQLAYIPSMLAVHPSLPARTVPEFVKLARARPGAINYGSGGIGTPSYITGELFSARAGISLTHVPYKSGGEALTAVITGEVPLFFAPLSTTLPLRQQGRLNGLAVTSAARLPAAPDLPTVAESGYPGFQTGNWYGLMVPAKTPADIVSAINRAALAVLKDPAIHRRLTDLGFVTVGDQPAEFAAHVQHEIASLAKVLKGLAPAQP